MQDYSDLGLNNRLRKTSAINSGTYINAIQFENLYEVQANKLNAAKVNLVNFIKRAGVANALGTFNSGPALNLTSAITYTTPKSAIRTFGRPIIGIYEGTGTAGSNQIYPIRGGSVTLGRYDVVGGEIDYSNYDGTSDEWRGMIIDTNGTSSQVINFVVDWIYADYVTGDAT